MQKGKLLVITGPSAGVGKDTLKTMFLEKHQNWLQPLSTTTRMPRPGEEETKSMNFISSETFEQWQKEGKFLETDFHADNWYGTLREPVEALMKEGKNVLLRVDVNGSLQIKDKIPDSCVVFIKAESEEVLKMRMEERGHSPAEIKERLELARKEMQLEPRFDYVIVNRTNQQTQALADIEKIALSIPEKSTSRDLSS